MKIATFNINGIRARLPLLITWLKDCNPDVVTLQETKCADDYFPVSELEDCGYNVINFGQKSFNGVAILSKHPIYLMWNIENKLKLNTHSQQLNLKNLQLLQSRQ